MKKEQSIAADIKKIQQSKQFLTILILLFMVMIFWVGVSIFSSQTTSKIDPELQKLARPLVPVIETDVFDTIELKKEYSSEELSQFTIYKMLTTTDGRTQRVVPLDFTLEDLDTTPAQSNTSGSSLLQSEIETTISTPTPTPAPLFIENEAETQDFSTPTNETDPNSVLFSVE